MCTYLDCDFEAEVQGLKDFMEKYDAKIPGDPPRNPTLEDVLALSETNLEHTQALQRAIGDLEKRLLTLQRYIHYQDTDPLDSFTKHG